MRIPTESLKGVEIRQRSDALYSLYFLLRTFAFLRLCVKLACSIAPALAGFVQQREEPSIVIGTEPAQQPVSPERGQGIYTM